MENTGKKKIPIVSHKGNGFVVPCQKALRRLGYDLDYFDYRTGLYYDSKIARKLFHIIPGAKRMVSISTSIPSLSAIGLGG